MCVCDLASLPSVTALLERNKEYDFVGWFAWTGCGRVSPRCNLHGYTAAAVRQAAWCLDLELSAVLKVGAASSLSGAGASDSRQHIIRTYRRRSLCTGTAVSLSGTMGKLNEHRGDCVAFFTGHFVCHKCDHFISAASLNTACAAAVPFRKTSNQKHPHY